MDLKLVICLALCHFVSASPQLDEDDNEVQNVISNLQLLIPLLIQDAETGQESTSRELESSDDTDSQYLPMPIQAFLLPNDKSQHSQPNYAPKQKALPFEGPFSDIPLEAFQLDRSLTTKKDLSRKPQLTIVPEELVQQCTGYIAGTFRPSRGNEELILNVCNELLDTGAVKDYAAGTAGHQQLHELREASPQYMNDDLFLEKVREFTRELEKKYAYEHENSDFHESSNLDRDDNEFHGFTNLDKFKERDDKIFHASMNIEELKKHDDNDNIFHESLNLEELKRHDSNVHEFTNLDKFKERDDNIFHEFKNLDEFKKHDDNKFHEYKNLDEFNGRGAKIPELQIENSDAHEFRIDIGKDHGNDVKLVVDGETLVQCDCCPHGVHRVNADVTARYDDNDSSFQSVMQKILKLLSPVQSQN